MSDGADTLPFALPDVGEREIEAVIEAIRSGWLSSGPRVQQFEAEFAATLGAGVQAVAVSSATAGLHLALEALGIQQGDEVLIPTWTFTATAEVVRYLGAEPVLVDVQPDTLNIDLVDAAKKLTERTRAIMPVHFAGHPISPQSLDAFSAEHGIGVVEDAAHAFPASVEGSLVGTGRSAATVFSFYATKTLTTGEGGMLVTRDAAVADRARVMRLHGISRDAFDRYRSAVPSWQYDVVAPGYKYNLTDPAAAMGLVQLARSNEMRASRIRIATKYNEAFAGLPIDLPVASTAGIEHAWHLYVVRMAMGGMARDTFIEEMARLGVACSVHFIPLHKQPYWRRRCSHQDIDFPVASAEYGRVVSLPIFSGMTAPNVERVVVAVKAALAS